MRELKIGERIPIEAGGEAVVSRELGRGGQGIVYLVRYNGREYALKWYFISRIKNPEAFRNNLRKNIEDGAPEGGKQFIWPLFLTETKKNGAFGCGLLRQDMNHLLIFIMDTAGRNRE